MPIETNELSKNAKGGTELQAEKLQDWLREKGAEANIGFIKKQFN